jgi:hypothetical protein
VADQARCRPSVELVDHGVQVAEVPDHMGLADEDQHLSSWLGEVNCHNEEDHLAEGMVGVVELAFAVHRTEEQGFVVAVVCCGACRYLDDHTGRQLVVVHKVQLACHQGRRLQDPHYALHRPKRQGHRSVP